MGLRQWIETHRGVSAVAGGTALALSGSLLFLSATGAAPAGPRVWFFDQVSGELFEAEGSPIPPIETPAKKPAPLGGPAGVRAHVFACGDCNDSSAREIGYLESNTPDAQRALIDATGGSGSFEDLAPVQRAELDEVLAKGQQVAEPKPPHTWVAIASEEGQRLVEKARGRCRGDKPLVECVP